MMAAIRAAQSGAAVTLIEKNLSLGRKLLMTGKGRCNLTNAGDLDFFIRRFSGHGDFLRDAFKAFFNDELIAFFAERGLKMKGERQGRIFPVTDRSASVLAVLKQELARSHVEICLGQAVQNLMAANKQVSGVVLANGKRVSSHAVILTTGGACYPETGSTGEGIAMAQRLGHAIVPLRPGLIPLETIERFPASLAGLTLKNIRLTFSDGTHQLISDVGEMLFTDFGVSGPLVLSLSGQIDEWLLQGKKVSLMIDLKPGMTPEEISARFLREKERLAKKSLGNMLKEFLPQRLVGPFLTLAQGSPSKKTAQVTIQERRALLTLFKHFPLRIKRTRPLREAMVTRGGISLKEIDPRTMQSRLWTGLFLAGEIMDVDGDTGGFNLQAAFSSGFLAGESAAKSLPIRSIPFA